MLHIFQHELCYQSDITVKKISGRNRRILCETFITRRIGFWPVESFSPMPYQVESSPSW